MTEGQTDTEPEVNNVNERRGTKVTFKVSRGTYILATEFIRTQDKDTLGTKWSCLEEYLENVCYEILAKKQLPQ